jgi:ABC-type phosphate/phosphonate transport system substrate-binding protein
MSTKFILGAVAYAPKVVTIWEGFKTYFEKNGLEMDYVLFSNYETQVEAMFKREIDVAWNSPLAHVRAERIGLDLNTPVRIGPMRDTDQDLMSVLVVKNKSEIKSLADLRGKTIGFGAVDSPQARLIPLDHLRQAGLDSDFKARLFDKLGGKHGDHIGGERDAAHAMMTGEIDAAWMIDGNFHAFSKEGVLPVGEARILAYTKPYDHCIFDFAPHASEIRAIKFTDILMGMKWTDPEVRPLLELEGLKEWRTGRTTGFALLNRAVDDEHFYSKDGKIVETNYRY